MQRFAQLFRKDSAFHIDPDQHPETYPLSHWIALSAVGYQALFGMTDLALVKPEFGALLAAVMLPFAGKSIWRQLAANPFVRVLGAFVAFALLQTVYLGASHSPVSLQDLGAEVSKPIKLGLCGVAIGAWLSVHPRMIGVMLKLVLAGLFGQAVFSLITAPWPALLDGSARLGFGYPENLSGAFAAIGVLAFSLLGLDASRHAARSLRRYTVATFALAALVMLAALLFAGSRGAWLAAATSTPVGIALFLRRDGWQAWARHWPGKRKAVLALMAMFAILALMLLHARARMSGAEDIGAKLLDGDIGTIPMSSVGIRLHLFSYGSDLFLQRPLLGHGLGAIQQLIAASSIRAGTYIPTHMHDIYLQAIVGLGLLGSAIMAWGLVVLCRQAFLAYRDGLVDARIFWLLAGSLLILMQVNLFDCLAWHLMHSRVPLEVLLGCAVACSLFVQSRRKATWRETVTPSAN